MDLIQKDQNIIVISMQVSVDRTRNEPSTTCTNDLKVLNGHGSFILDPHYPRQTISPRHVPTCLPDNLGATRHICSWRLKYCLVDCCHPRGLPAVHALEWHVGTFYRQDNLYGQVGLVHRQRHTQLEHRRPHLGIAFVRSGQTTNDKTQEDRYTGNLFTRWSVCTMTHHWTNLGMC
jgi:hypothetical protein